MKMYIRFSFLYWLLLAALLPTGCKKYLDQKPDKKMALPATLKDLQRLLDNTDIMNSGFPSLGEITSDDAQLSEEDWLALDFADRANYCFDNIETNNGEWSRTYRTIVYSNIVLEGLAKIAVQPNDTYDRAALEGAALFFRAHGYYQLVQVFAPHYDESTAHTQLGIVLRQRSDINEPLTRSTVAASYAAILSDLERAASLLPTTDILPTRPTKAAAYALLARTYLTMGRYEEVAQYTDSALQYQSTLLNFNALDTLSNTPFPRFYGETIHDCRMNVIVFQTNRATISPELVASYDLGDLRGKLFLRRNNDGSYRFKGAYDGINGSAIFNGITTAELYLNAAECLARSGETADALDMMNHLLSHRWKTGHFEPRTLENTPDVLAFVLTERRKELLYRGLRWIDLRRLANEGRLSTGIRRALGDDIYELSPEQLINYAYKLPVQVNEEGNYLQN